MIMKETINLSQAFINILKPETLSPYANAQERIVPEELGWMKQQ